ncbi:MAG: monofunctional biosynthetic peptidoglycan transglycosylase [Candidatus Acidiferrales bacterium]
MHTGALVLGDDPTPQRRPRSIWRWTRRLVLLLAAAVIGWHGWIFWQVWRLREENPNRTAFMEQGLARLHERNPQARLKHRWAPYGQISVHLKRAVVAAEDQKFLSHEGFDWDEVEKAYERNLQSQRVVRGASTISQQLAKNLFLTQQRTYWRKAEEAVITLMIEGTLPKRRILEIYLNVIEWGNGVYGAEAAARHYYGKSASGLSADEAARLAAMIPNPRFYDRRRSTPWLEQRTELLLSQMEFVPVP